MSTMVKFLMALSFIGSLIGVLMGCQESSIDEPIFHEEGKPKFLSEWNVLNIKGANLELTERVMPYDLNTPLFSDYARKLRTVWMPKGSAAVYEETDPFNFPIGTIISKTFYYPTSLNETTHSNRVLKADDSTTQKLILGLDLRQVKLIETRLLVHREDGWVALPYVWNEDESDAVLQRVGDIKSLSLDMGDGNKDFAYIVPNENQCAGCHATNATTRAVQPIGPRSRHLNKDYLYEHGLQNQLAAWAEQGILENVPSVISTKPNALWGDTSQSLNHRARSYLDINCSHCHNAVGPADTSGLLLEPTDEHGVTLGVCKLPIAAGTGTGNRTYGIEPSKPEESILTFRMESIKPSEMMPELGRSLSHEEGVELIKTWIEQMSGHCGVKEVARAFQVSGN